MLLLMSLYSSCRVASRLEEGDKLLVKNKIQIKPSAPVDEETMQNVIKQKPNTRLLFLFRFNAWLYQKFDSEKLERKRDKKQYRIDRRNKRRAEKNKPLVKKSNETWRDRIVKNIGEKPTVYDSTRTEVSKQQLEIFMNKNGYFDAQVTHKARKTKRKVKSKYIIYSGEAHKVDSVSITVNDPGIKSFLPKIEKLFTVKKGARFEVETLEKDRAAITSLLNNSGYYSFSKQFITFEVDTLREKYKADINMIIGNPKVESAEKPDSLVDVWHKKYVIGRIDFKLDYNPLAKDYDPSDRMLIEKHTFEYIDELDFEPELLINNILIREGEIYELDKALNTYKKLRNLGVFSYINIEFEEDGIRNGLNKLRCRIHLNTGKSQAFGSEVTGTHRDGIWGVNFKSSYSHNNLLKGAENLEVKLALGAEAQRSIIDTDNSDETTDDIRSNLKLNTFLIGPEVGLNLHKLVFFPNFSKRFSTPITRISALYNYQIRPDYERSLVELSFGWSFKESRKSSFYISPFTVSRTKIDRSLRFQELLDNINDQFLINSYQDHYIPSFLKTSWEYNSQTQQLKKRYMYNKMSLESSGLNTRLVFDAFSSQEKDENGSYTIEGIRFAQFIKFDNDLRYFKNFSRNHSIATRLNIGVGLPYSNSKVLPFEKSFFAGGANGIRAWQARSLGPGSYRDTSALITYDNLGELKMSFSSEYRFDLTNLFEGALFFDAGNIWIIDDEDNKVGSEISNDFTSEIAFGAGFGLRLDFDFFLVRFDLGFKLKDPSLVKGERWAWQPKDEYNLFLDDLRSGLSEDEMDTFPNKYSHFPNFNLGIGYPF